MKTLMTTTALALTIAAGSVYAQSENNGEQMEQNLENAGESLENAGENAADATANADSMHWTNRPTYQQFMMFQ